MATPRARWPDRPAAEDPAFNAVNRGKLGIVLDLKQASARDAFRRLAAHGRRPRRKLPARRDGASGTRLRDARRRRTHASFTPRSPAMGRPGPRRQQGGFDLVAQEASRIMPVTGGAGQTAGEGRGCRSPISEPGSSRSPASSQAIHWPSPAPAAASSHSTHRSSRPVSRSPYGRPPSISPGQVPGPLGSAHRMSAPVPGVSLRRRLRGRSAPPTIARSESWRRCSAIPSG